MKNKRTNKKLTASERSSARRTRILQIVFVAFSLMLILSMVLSLTRF